MPRRRRSRRVNLYRPLKVAKYSNETYAFASTMSSSQPGQYPVILTKSTDILGTRKAKNFTLSLCVAQDLAVVFALVFVPQGTTPSSIEIGTTVDTGVLISDSLYDPNQNVILQGVTAGLSSGVARYKTRLARNLNSGDAIYLILYPLFWPSEVTQAVVYGTLNYAISY